MKILIFSDFSEVSQFFQLNSLFTNKIKAISYNTVAIRTLYICTLYINVNELEVYEAVYKVKSNATGLDGIPMKFIKMTLPVLLPYITHLLNYSITSSICPQSWKKAKTFPVHKRTRFCNLEDFRAINVLPILSKVLEILLRDQLLVFLRQYNLLTRHQSGFRSGHSTTTALLKVSHDIARALDRMEVAVLLLLDFSKAFDSVDHVLLVNKLRVRFRFDSSALSMISSYLSDRVQAVCIGGVMSSFLELKRGIPQGTVLGPLLFSLFVNDLPDNIKYVNVHLFADDVQLYKTFGISDLAISVSQINSDLKAVGEWAKANYLNLNAKKSKGIIVNLGPLVRLNGVSIHFFNKLKSLGMTINSTFTWDDTAEKIYERIFAGLRSLWPLAGCTPFKTRAMLAKALLMPHFEYCCTMYSYGLNYVSMRLLNSALHAIVRYVYAVRRRDGVNEHVERFLGCQLDQFFRLRPMVFLYKLIYSKTPGYLRELLEFGDSDRTYQLAVERMGRRCKNSLFGRDITDWNGLPVRVRLRGSCYLFRRDCI